MSVWLIQPRSKPWIMKGHLHCLTSTGVILPSSQYDLTWQVHDNIMVIVGRGFCEWCNRCSDLVIASHFVRLNVVSWSPGSHSVLSADYDALGTRWLDTWVHYCSVVLILAAIFRFLISLIPVSNVLVCFLSYVCWFPIEKGSWLGFCFSQ